MDLSNAHLTQASQAERWIKKIQKLHNFCYVFIIFIITKFGENFEEKFISASFKMFWWKKWRSKRLKKVPEGC